MYLRDSTLRRHTPTYSSTTGRTVGTIGVTAGVPRFAWSQTTMTRTDFPAAHLVQTSRDTEMTTTPRGPATGALALAATLFVFGGIAWLFASGQLYGLDAGTAVGLTLGGHALILGAAVRIWR